MGGPNLEVFKFGMYIMFPIGIMYYFGTNLDSRFQVPDFWPKEGQSNTIPFDKEDIADELSRLKGQRLANRARRLEMERQGQSTEVTINQEKQAEHSRPEVLDTVKMQELQKTPAEREGSWGKWFR